MEEWRNIEGYVDYQVSNLGRVKSTQYHNGTYERILKLNKNKKGYQSLKLYKNGKVKRCSVHRLVAQAFIPNPDNLPMVNHKDENPSNNHVDNLEWCDNKYNLTYGSRIERVVSKTKNGKCSKTVYQYTLDGEFIREWPSVNEVERQYGYYSTFISACCRGKYKKAYGYVWRYAS